MLTLAVISPHGVQRAHKQATLTSCSVYSMSALSVLLYLRPRLSAFQVPLFSGTHSIISCFPTPNISQKTKYYVNLCQLDYTERRGERRLV